MVDLIFLERTVMLCRVPTNAHAELGMAAGDLPLPSVLPLFSFLKRRRFRSYPCIVSQS